VWDDEASNVADVVLALRGLLPIRKAAYMTDIPIQNEMRDSFRGIHAFCVLVYDLPVPLIAGALSIGVPSVAGGRVIVAII